MAVDKATKKSVGESWVNFSRTLDGAKADKFGAELSGNLDMQSIVDKYNQQTGQHAKYLGKDKVDFGWGAVDAVRNWGGKDQGLWFGENVWDDAATSSSNATTATTAATKNATDQITPFTSATASTSTTAKAEDPRSGQLWDQLQGVIKQGTNVDPNDPVVKAQTDAYRNEQTRGMRDYLSNAAESAGANANLDPTTRMAYEKAGTNTANFQAGAMATELTQRRQQIQQALSTSKDLLTSEEQMALTDELHKLDVSLEAWETQEKLKSGESQFARNLASNNSQFDRSLATNDSQFSRNLAQNAYEYDTSRYDNLYGG